ncbi:hypothetical protein FPRO04_09824 [Fusarium proliferatum]|uniref:Uncharacterized protein n=1 Tax=Gibberella intermedia TaxID=948311 RepID=A0A365MXC6_GIBIN|nr:hypothetical protein FPRO04_09824 [Fusarium proliferatum]RBA13209.1 hypothetical protein FPRO05_13636 [Fusarium proliferatum]
MLVNTICLIAFAAVAMAAPQRTDFNRDPNNNGDRTAQMARVEDLRNKGLTCNEAAQETFVCSDGLGGDCSVNIFGEGSCLI